MTEIYHMALPTHALREVQVRLKSVINEGQFSLEAESVFCFYYPTHCSGVTEICNIATPAHVLQVLHVRLKAVSNKGHFTQEAETVFRLYRTAQYSGVTGI
jgi:hypothetical protein